MSKIEVNTITQQCGPTLTVGGGACKSVTVDATTVTIGKSGGTVTLACGATQSGFGQTYTSTEYCTTVKTAPFTAVAGKGYFVNTSCGAVTVTLPASPTAGDTVSISDYAGTWGTNAVTLCRNSSKIGGTCNNVALSSTLQSTSLIYIDSTQGWKTINDATVNVGAPDYISATGGCVAVCGDYKIHTFTADGCFSVLTAPTPANNNVDYLVVAGGGAGGGVNQGGGGGAGGYRESHTVPVSGSYTASPLASATPLTVSAQTYPVTVGAGGAGIPGLGTAPSQPPGSPSSFSTITSAGGGRGGGSGSATAASGGSGGGGGEAASGASGNTPPVSPPQGKDGGSSSTGAGAGGGGAIGAGCNAPPGPGGNGGAGTTTGISGAPSSYGGGGGGGAYAPPATTGGTGGTGGGGPGGPWGANGTPGTVNTGGGGGANGPAAPYVPGSGGSGIVIIRYKYQ